MLDRVLRHYVIVPYDERMSREWAEIRAHRERIGIRIECGDCWIAASARRHDLPLIAHNAADFREIPGLTVIAHADAS